MAWIKRGYLHLLNNSTATLTLSSVHFDLIEGQFGGFLEKNLEKMLKNHDRRPGSFKETSKIKELIEQYNHKTATLYEVSAELARLVFQKREGRGSDSKTGLFIMRVDTPQSQFIMGLEFNRMEKYQINTSGGRNNVVANPMLLPNATPKKSTLFTIDLRNLEMTLLENEGSVFREVLDVDLNDSLNLSLLKARTCLYNTLTKIEDRDTTLEDIAKSNNEEKIERVNKFELSIASSVVSKLKIDFVEVAKEVFFDSRMLNVEFLNRLSSYKVPQQVKALSDCKIATQTIALQADSKEKRLKLKNGIELIIPNDVEEIRTIHIQEINGELVEVEDNE